MGTGEQSGGGSSRWTGVPSIASCYKNWDKLRVDGGGTWIDCTFYLCIWFVFFVSEQYSGPNVGPSSARRREGNSSENAESWGVLVSSLTNWHLMQLTAHGWKIILEFLENSFIEFSSRFFLTVWVFHFPFSFAVKDAEDNIVFEDGQGVWMTKLWMLLTRSGFCVQIFLKAKLASN